MPALTWWFARVRIFHTRYAITKQGLWLRTGYFSRRWRLVPHGHIQAVETVASPFDRRKGLARILVDAPSSPAGFHAVSIPFLAASTAEEIRRGLGITAARRSMVG